MSKTMTVAIMDPPYESARSASALRLVAAALEKGCAVTVFAYEGAVSMTMKDQKPHENPVHGTTCDAENHPTTKDWVAALFTLAKSKGVKLDWINCGLCVDERGAGSWIDGPRRGGPKDFVAASLASDQTLVIPVK